MPFKSKAQQGYMFAQHPGIAKEWTKKYGVPKDLPAKVEARKKALSNHRLPIERKAEA